jgi:ribosome-associated toxin RatA of RatAB toxin-antitoxin module
MMSRVAKSAIISNNPDRIMDYIADVKNHPAFIGPLKAVANLNGDSRKPGTSWDWTFVMAGVEFSGRAETLSYEGGKKFTYRTTTGIQSTFTYSAEPEGKGVKVTVDVTYDVPSTLLSKMQASVVEKLNDAEGVRAVENLKAILDQ